MQDAKFVTFVIWIDLLSAVTAIGKKGREFDFHFLMFGSPCILRKLVDDKPTWHTKFLKYIYLSTTLHVSGTMCPSSGEIQLH
jgi:hypothetical protein